MKKRTYITIGMAVLVVLFILGMIVWRSQMDNGSEEYTNFFKYSVEHDNHEWRFVPARFQYGMSMEEVLQIENLDESAIVENGIITTQILTDISENIEEVQLEKHFGFRDEDFGLMGVTYRFLIDKDDMEEMCSILAEQAEAYMPELVSEDFYSESASEEGVLVCSGSLEDITNGVEWIYHEEISENSFLPKSRVSLGLLPIANDDTKVYIYLGIGTPTVYLQYLKNA